MVFGGKAAQPEEPAPDYVEPPWNELERVYRWRRRMFVRLGFNRRQAVALAEAQVDWHEAEKLLRQGCPIDVAFDYLS